MATEDGAPAAAPTPADKPQAPKPVVPSFGSSFINKNAGGKKFAPKAVGRRRPQPAAKAAPKPAPEPAAEAPRDELAALLAEAEGSDDHVPVTQPTPVAAPVLPPTPAATQETTAPVAPESTQNAPPETTPPVAQMVPSAPASPPPTQIETPSAASPKRKRTEDTVAVQEPTPVVAVARMVSPPPTAEAADSGPSPKRARTEPATESVQRAPMSEVPAVAPLATPPATAPAPSAAGPPIDPALEHQGQPAQTVAPLPDTPAVAPVPALGSETQQAESPAAASSTPGTQTTPASQLRKRKLPWQSVNQPGDGEDAAGTAGTPRPTVPPKGRRKVVAVRRAEPSPSGSEDEDDEDEEESEIITRPAPRTARTARAKPAENVSKEWVPEAPPPRPRKQRKDIGQTRKKRATKGKEPENQEVAEGDSVTEGQTPSDTTPRLTASGRRPRWDKGMKRGPMAPRQRLVYDPQALQQALEARESQERDERQEGQEGQAAQEVEEVQEGQEAPDGEGGETYRPTKPKKPTAPKRKRAAPKPKPAVAEGEQVEGATGEAAVEQPKKPRGGRVRETTPEDAEDHVIDPENTFMHDIANREVRLGKLSRREMKMREINWEEVKEKRRREAQTVVSGLAQRHAVDEELNRAAEALREAQGGIDVPAGPRFQMVDGQIVLLEDSVVNRAEADADREIELMEEVEEDDLTVRITTKSFLRESKRFPNEFMLPGQGTRWNAAMNEKFYEALQMFGTDFGMIATLFPGSTRRSIKLKFNREERQNAQKVKAALNAQRNSDWQEYLDRSGIPQNAFKDPEAIAEELRVERETAEIEINAAKAKADEERRQRRIAGIELTDDEAEGGEAGKTKKKKGRQAKAVSFADDANVEVLGTIDDDTWDD